MKTYRNLSCDSNTSDAAQRYSKNNDLPVSPSNRLSAMNQHKIQKYATAFLENKVQQFQFNETNNCTAVRLVAQRVLMDVSSFKIKKDNSTNPKKVLLISKKRSTKDYEKLYKEYHKFLNDEDYKSANKMLLEIENKVTKMSTKGIYKMDKENYWKSSEEKAVFINELKQSIKEEKIVLGKKWLLSASSSALFYIPSDIINMDSTIAAQYLEREQCYRIVEEVLLKLYHTGRINLIIVTDKDFFAYLKSDILDLKTYIGVYNKILEYLYESAQTITLEKLIGEIKNSTSLSAEEKVIEAATILMGNFTWYVNDDGNNRDAEQLDEFILWATGKQETEPSGAAKMNCWEGIIFAIYKAGLITKEAIASKYIGHNYASVNHSFEVINKSNIKNNFWYKDKKVIGSEPSRGDIIYCWTDLSSAQPYHVVLALGGGECMSLWRSTCGNMGRTTLNSLKGSFEAITYASRPWQ